MKHSKFLSRVERTYGCVTQKIIHVTDILVYVYFITIYKFWRKEWMGHAKISRKFERFIVCNLGPYFHSLYEKVNVYFIKFYENCSSEWRTHTLFLSCDECKIESVLQFYIRNLHGNVNGSSRNHSIHGLISGCVGLLLCIHGIYIEIEWCDIGLIYIEYMQYTLQYMYTKYGIHVKFNFNNNVITKKDMIMEMILKLKMEKWKWKWKSERNGDNKNI